MNAQVRVLVCLLGLWLVDGTVQAAVPRKVAVQLQGPVDDMPAHVCLLATTLAENRELQHASKPLKKLSGWFEQPVNQPCGDLSEATKCETVELTAARLPAVVSEGDAGAFSEESARSVHEALRAMYRTNVASSKEEPNSMRQCRFPEACVASFSAERSKLPNLELICTANEQPPSEHATREGRVAVLQFTSPYGAEAPIRAVQYRGTSLIISLGQNYSDDEPTIVTLAVVGGHYVRGESRVITEQGALPLSLRCGTHRVSLTGARPRGLLTAKLKRPGQGDLECKPETSPFDFEIPYSDAYETKTLTVEVLPSAPGLAPESTYTTNWTRTPPPDLELRAQRIALDWQGHCAYPWGECPDLALPDAGGASCRTLAGDPTSRCHYVCEGPPSFELPTRARFTTAKKTADKGITDTWDASLTRAGDVLAGYIPSDERHVTVRFQSWGDNEEEIEALLQRPGERIAYVRVRGPTGDLHRIKPNGSDMHVRLPGVACTDHLTFQIAGDRSYEERVVPIDQGHAYLAAPADTIRDKMALGVSAGVGLLPPPPGFPDNSAWLPFLSAEAGLLWRPLSWVKGSRWKRPYFDFRAGALVSTYQYRTRVARDLGLEPVVDSEPYLRFPLAANVVYALTGGYYAGIGGGLVFGTSAFAEDAERAPRQMRAILNAYVGANIPASLFAPEFAVRYIPDEAAYSFETAAAGNGGATHHAIQTLMFEFRLRVGN